MAKNKNNFAEDVAEGKIADILKTAKAEIVARYEQKMSELLSSQAAELALLEALEKRLRES